MGIEIRQAGIEDRDALRELCIATFVHAYAAFNTKENMQFYLAENFSEEKITEELEDEDSVFFVAEENGKMCGYVKLGLDPPKGKVHAERPLEILRLYAAVAHIGNGIGKLLIDQVVKFATELRCDAVQLDVWQKNKAAIKFYLREQFIIDGTTTFRLGHDLQNDWIMLRKL